MGLLIRVENHDGHVVDVHGGDGFLQWAPKNVTEFRDAILEGKPLTMAIKRATTSVTGPTTNFSGESDVEFTWPASFSIQVFGLVPGGWLPAAVCESTLLLPDANLAGSFSTLDDEASRMRAMSGLADVPLLALGTNRVSAALAAYEGGDSRRPTLGEFGDRFKGTALRLKRGFPEREVVFPNHAVINAGYAALVAEAPEFERNARYLQGAYPLVSNRVDDALLGRRQAALRDLAAKFGVSHTSFVHLLVLDCLYDEGPTKKKMQRPGRRVLKPKKVFESADIYNAMSDVMHMQRLCQAHVVMPGERPVLCTMDHGLAQAWAMLGPYSMRREASTMTVSFRLDETFALRLRGKERDAFFAEMN